MKKLVLLLLITFSSFFISKTAYSQWFLGGEITYDCVGQDSFMVKVTLYRDCNMINFNQLTIKAYCIDSFKTIISKQVSVGSVSDITPNCDTCSRCESPSCSFPYGIEKGEYYTMFDLSNTNCCGITFSVQNCCRQNTIATGSTNKTFYLEAMINKCIAPENNSPKFHNNPLNIICVGQDYTFNNGVFDNDKDTIGGLIDYLTYEWVYPKESRNSSLSYSGQYDYDKPIFYWGFPMQNSNLQFPRGFHLDSYTGDIGFRPMKVEQTVMALKVKEYRKGIKIGEITRDMQFIVISCPNNIAPLLSGPYYKEICEGSSVSFNIRTMDYNPNDTLRISWDSSIAGATWSVNNVKHPTGVLSWTAPIGSGSNIPYVFHATVKDDACPVPGTSTRTYQILVKPLPIATMTAIDSGCGEYYFKAIPKVGTAPNYQWIGNFNPGFQNVGNSIHYKFSDTGSYPYTMIMTTGTGTLTCSRTYFDTIEINDFVKISLPNDTIICEGSNIAINADYNSTLSLKQLIWSTGDTNINPITLTNLFSDTTIIVTAINDSGCVATDTMRIFIDNFNVSPFQLAPVCDGEEAIIFANPDFDIGQQAISYKWVGLSCGCTKGTSDTFKTYYQADFILIAHNENGCMATDTITTVIHPLPGINSSLTNRHCLNHPTIGLDSFFNPKGGQWTLQGHPQKITQLNFAQIGVGSHAVTYEITDSNNCYNDLQIGFDVIPLSAVNVKTFDSVCSKSGNYFLNGNPVGGVWKGGIVSHSAQYYVNTDSVNVNNAQLFPLIYVFTDSNGCTNQDTLNLTIVETKDISFQRMKGCEGDTVELVASPAGGLWTGKGVSGNELHTAKTGNGNHMVYYIYDHMGCVSDDSVSINIIPYPNANISISNDTVSAEQGHSMYQWYRNDTLLSGETDYFIIPVTSGDYHCVISNNYGCETITQKRFFIPTSINPITQKDFSVYPNPVINGLLTIDVSKLNLSNFNLLILDDLGKQIYFEEISNKSGKINRKIEFPSAGSYTVLVISDGERYFKRIIVK